MVQKSCLIPELLFTPRASFPKPSPRGPLLTANGISSSSHVGLVIMREAELELGALHGAKQAFILGRLGKFDVHIDTLYLVGGCSQVL